MAPKRPNHLDEPPSASSDDYDEEEESEQEQSQAQPNQPNKSHSENQHQQEESDEEDEESEEEEDEEEEEGEEDIPSNPERVTKTPSIQNPIPNPTQKPKSSSESESNEGSDSEPESNKTQQSPTASQFTIKPHVLPSKRPTVLSLPSKRPNEDNTVVDSRKKNKVEKDEENKPGEEKKGPGISRLWSEEDEIILLKGMADYHAKKGTDPYVDMTAVHDFIKGSLSVDVMRNQLTDKIYRLKKKYQNNVKKGENGEDPVFSKPHEHKSFELSKKIWGGGGGSNVKDENVKSNSKSKDRKSGKVNNFVESSKEDGKEIVVREVLKSQVNVEEDDFRSKYPRLSESLDLEKSSYLSLPEGVKNFVREKISLVGSAKAKELEERWKNFRLKEFELFTKRVELIQEQSKLVLDAVKSSES